MNALLIRAAHLQSWLKQHQVWLGIGFFAAGFLLDALTLSRIDSVEGILRQGIYLILIAVFLLQMTREHLKPPQVFTTSRWPQIRLWLVHFLFGNLLSLYTLFYFKSASHLSSLIFLAFLSGILVLNELTRFQSLDLRVKWGLLSLCMLSYLAYLVPMLMRRMGYLPFSLAALLALLLPLLAWRPLMRYAWDPLAVRQVIVWPWVSVIALFALLFFVKVVPPVPLSIQHIGIYHDVKKENGVYRLSSLKSSWRFWESGDQSYAYRSGDKVYCFFQIFSPMHFRDQVFVRWYLRDPKRGWIQADRVPVQILGGRAEGFRGYTYKSNVVLGKWKIEIETSDGREIGRVHVHIENDLSQDPRIYKIKEI